ncbi:MAG: ABC transporter ATP-binding protein [Halanaerobiales bacterium]
MPEEIVKINNVSKKYLSFKGETQALVDINLNIKKDEFIAIVGPSGCGKTTLLSIISGLLEPDNGEVFIKNKKISDIRPEIGYMLQEDYLFEWRTVYDNVKLSLEIKGLLDENTPELIHNLLAKYDLENFSAYYPSELSGGMRQRVALARTLAPDPEILLLDEPFSSLDYQTKLRLEEEMYETLLHQPRTVLLVTHDIAEAISMSERVIVLSARPGKIKHKTNVQFARDKTPLEKRKVKSFQNYFDSIWRELN